MKNKIVLITGASSGIGWATAEAFADQGANLILCGRRKERLEKLSQKLATKILLLTFDVRDRKAVFESLGHLPKEWKNVDILINNAGNAHGLDPVQTANLDDWDAMIDGNVYCSSKYAVDAFTQGLRIDLNPDGIKVSAIHPGLVHTEFSEVRFKGDQNRADKVYEGIEALKAKDVADAILYIALAPAKVNIADLVLLPTRQANAYISNRK